MYRTCLLLISIAAMLVSPAASADEADDAPLITVATTRFGGADLISLDIKGENVARLIENERENHGDMRDPSWHPDGRRLVFVSAGNPGTLRLFDSQTATITPLAGSPTDRGACWSPDGKKLLLTSDREGNPDIFMAAADGTGIVNLTHHAAYDADPAWSPEGDKIAFTSNRTGSFRLYTMKSDGTELNDLLKQDLLYSVYPSWSPDAQQIVFGGRGGDNTIQLFVVNADGGGLQQISEGAAMNTYAAWSPDGQYIAYGRFSTNRVSDDDNTAPKGDLMLYDSVAGAHAKLLTAELPIVGPRPCWRPRPQTP
jgi:Tol biopolymer transport system component